MAQSDELRKAGEARHILDHPLYKEAWEAVRNNAIREIERGVVDERIRAELCLTLMVLKQLNLQFQKHIDTGQLVASSNV